jgi:hypothetical protein
MADRTRFVSAGAALCAAFVGCVERAPITPVFDVFNFLREDGVNLPVKPPINSVSRRLRPKKDSVAGIVMRTMRNPRGPQFGIVSSKQKSGPPALRKDAVYASMRNPPSNV